MFPSQFANIFLTHQRFVTSLHLLRVELHCKLQEKLHRVTGPLCSNKSEVSFFIYLCKHLEIYSKTKRAFGSVMTSLYSLRPILYSVSQKKCHSNEPLNRISFLINIISMSNIVMVFVHDD